MAIKLVRCPKCNSDSGNSWSQCRRECPMKTSPHYKRPTVWQYFVGLLNSFTRYHKDPTK